jgi:hypothetical protein
MATRMQQRKGTAAQWISTNSSQGPVLNAGEIGFEIDTNKFKIGDGINHWVDLVYFTDSASALAAINAVIDAAPAALNTLNELAAAINDDPTFFTTMATNLSNHQSDTTNIHGIADTSLLATTANVATAKSEAISTASSDATTKANNAKSGAEATASADATSKANAAQAAAEATAAADATSKANAAKSGAETTAANALSSHESDTTNVHGITDTAALATRTYADNAASQAVAALVASAPSTLNTLNELSAAIANNPNYATDVANLVATKADTTYVDTEITNAVNSGGQALSDHSSDTTGIHGIANTALLATQEYVTDAIANSTDSYPELAGDGIAWNAGTLEFDVDNTVARTSATDLLASIEYVDDEINAVRDEAAAAAAGLLTGATKTNITITGDKNGLTISAENGVADSTTDNLSEGTNNLYFNTERAQDAVGNSVGTGLSYNDATGAVSVNTTTIQAKVANVDDTEIGYLNGVTSGIQTQIDAKAPSVSPALSGTPTAPTAAAADNSTKIATTAYADRAASNAAASLVASAPAALDTLNELASALGNDASFSTTVSNSIGLKAPLASPTFTGTVSGITKSMVGLDNVDNTTDALKPVSTATQSALDLKAPLASPTFTGTVAGITKSMVGLGSVDNTTDAAKPVSTATQTALDLKANLASPTLTGTPLAPTAVTGTNTTQVATTGFVQQELSILTTGAPALLNTLDELAAALGDDANYAATVTTALSTKAPLASPTFTGTVSGITKTMVGLGSVDNTTDADKPVSTATQTALDLKLASATAASTYAPLASPTFTGTVSGITKSMVGLANVDNTTDAAKPVSTATQTALDLKLAATSAESTYATIANNNLKAPLASPALTGTPTAPTATAGTNTTQIATTAYADAAVAALVASAPAALNTLNELATALGNDASFSTTVTTSLSSKAPLASPTFTGTATIPTLTLTNPLTAANGGTGLSSLGTGVATFLGTPSSANLAAMITDEIGTGNIVLSEVATTAPAAGSYTLVATDRGKLVEMSGGSANTLTVPLHSTIPYPTGTQIDILQVGSGQTTVAGATVGVTINGTPGLKIRAQWGGATLIKRGENLWVLIGDLTV